MQTLWPPIPRQNKMTFPRRSPREARKNSIRPYSLTSVSPSELPEILSCLQTQLGKVQTDTTFLALKQSELKPDDQISLFGMMDAREQLNIERSLLAGHAYMIQEMVNRKKVMLDRKSEQVLRNILHYTCAIYGRV
ncbi:MAG: hypothetical protein PHR77_03195 [Kiritimatiellae bacterium]|nr:hypothetical protein [Kiritimatiellia bacterium]MDD5519563.1 hypothetical protein [Kiritimatiellia bacterium]